MCRTRRLSWKRICEDDVLCVFYCRFPKYSYALFHIYVENIKFLNLYLQRRYARDFGWDVSGDGGQNEEEIFRIGEELKWVSYAREAVCWNSRRDEGKFGQTYVVYIIYFSCRLHIDIQCPCMEAENAGECVACMRAVTSHWKTMIATNKPSSIIIYLVRHTRRGTNEI